MNPVDVRQQLVDALRLDLVGPSEVLGSEEHVVGSPDEVLPQRPSTWYLTGFLVPLDADPEQKTDEQSTEQVDEVGNDPQGTDDAVAPEPAAARVRFLPSSMGASLLVPADATTLKILVRWGDYLAGCRHRKTQLLCRFLDISRRIRRKRLPDFLSLE